MSGSWGKSLVTLVLLAFVAGCNQADQGVALGTLERDRVALTATAGEVIVDLPVTQGTFVKAGTLLVQLDATEQQAKVNRAAAEVSKATANLEKLRNGAREEELAKAKADVAGAKAALIEAGHTFKRFKDLASRGTASQASFDSAVANRDAADATLISAQEQLRELVNGTREEDLRAAEADRAAAEASLASAQKVLEDLSVVASRDGLLDSLPWNLGERVTAGSPVAVLLAGVAPYARVYVPEPYRVKIKQGDTLRVHIDGLDTPLSGKVRWISSEPAFTPYYALNQEERARLMYPAEIQLPDSASGLPNGVPAQVDLP